jgi:glycosyltransferase involved in cell wall biosynthesis
MKVGLSAISFVPGKMGGVETYFRNLVHNLLNLKEQDSYTLFCDRRFAGEFAGQSAALSVHPISFARPSFNWFARGLLRNTLNIDPLTLAFRKVELDVLHHPFTVLTPPGLTTPSVLTFWDMQQEFYPEFFSPAELRKRKRTFRSSAEQATRVIVSAEFTRKCLVERYQIDPDKIDVVYTGYGANYRVTEDADALARLRSRYGLERPFLYYPAATWPHKNHKNLLAALKILKEETGFDGDLVLTGVAMQSHGAMQAEVERLGLADRVKMLGYLDYAELPYLYNAATMLVFPSFFEGFGIPLVEAMACGCPVACSDATSLPEIVGPAGQLFDPASPRDIAAKVWLCWSDEKARREMARLGLERARLFDWRTTALKTREVYRKAAEAAR